MLILGLSLEGIFFLGFIGAVDLFFLVQPNSFFRGGERTKALRDKKKDSEVQSVSLQKSITDCRPTKENNNNSQFDINIQLENIDF